MAMLEKLKELILYIAAKSQDDDAFGAIKLNKILFTADFFAFGLWGKPITEAVYVHRPLGPAPQELLAARDGLIADKSAALQTREYFGHQQIRVVPLRDPNMTLFTEAERKLIDDVIGSLKHFNGTGVSEWT